MRSRFSWAAETISVGAITNVPSPTRETTRFFLSGLASLTPIAAGISYPMQLKPNSKCAKRPSVASHTF